MLFEVPGFRERTNSMPEKKRMAAEWLADVRAKLEEHLENVTDPLVFARKLVLTASCFKIQEIFLLLQRTDSYQ